LTSAGPILYRAVSEAELLFRGPVDPPSSDGAAAGPAWQHLVRTRQGGIEMAYLTFAESTAGSPVAFVPVAPAPSFSALEWQVVALARRDRVSSLRRPGALSAAMGSVFGGRNPRLADPKLEALRRMAVLSWHRGYSVEPHEVRAFTQAGFTPEQYELLLDSIEAAQAGRRAH
jgi:hypothetical protein